MPTYYTDELIEKAHSFKDLELTTDGGIGPWTEKFQNLKEDNFDEQI